MKRRNTRPCVRCRVRRTRAKGGVCLQCRGGDCPEVRREGDALHIGSLSLSREAALRLANLIIDAIEGDSHEPA